MCCSHKSRVNLSFRCAEMSSRVQESTNVVCIEVKDDVLYFFRAALRYSWMSTEITSLIERLKVCMKAHLRREQWSPAYRTCKCVLKRSRSENKETAAGRQPD